MKYDNILETSILVCKMIFLYMCGIYIHMVCSCIDDNDDEVEEEDA